MVELGLDPSTSILPLNMGHAFIGLRLNTPFNIMANGHYGFDLISLSLVFLG